MTPTLTDAGALRLLSVAAAVMLDLGEEVLDCCVHGVDDVGEVTLTPVIAADAAYIPSLGRAATLQFRSGRGWRRVAGAVRPAGDDKRIVFAVSSGDLPPRRQVVRVGIQLAVALTRLTEDGHPIGDAHELMTTDISLGGLGVRLGTWALEPDMLVGFVLALPSGPARGTARVLRITNAVAGIELVDVPREDRMHLAEFLLANRAAQR